MVFSPLAATSSEVVQTDDTVFQFMHPFADRLAVPAEIPFGAALPTRTQLFDGARHKEPTGTALQRLGGDGEERFEGVCHIHSCSSRSWTDAP